MPYLIVGRGALLLNLFTDTHGEMAKALAPAFRVPAASLGIWGAGID